MDETVSPFVFTNAYLADGAASRVVVGATGRSPLRRRRSVRLRRFDYASPGAYYVTICTWNRVCLFGEVVDDRTVLNPMGEIAADEWARSGDIRAEIALDEWIIMPNHMHAIVFITARARSRGEAAPPPPAGRPHGPSPGSLGALLAGFKSAVTRRINVLRGTPGAPVWHRSYHEHVIRHDDVLNRIRRYIAENPRRWHEDVENPGATP